jgi:hypothetical protein
MKKIVLLFASFFAFGAANAQTASQTVNVVIPQVTLIGIATNTAQSLTYIAPGSAGANMADVSSGTPIYLQYSSMMLAASTDRAIYVTTSTSETNLTGITLTAVATVPAVNTTTSNGNIGVTGGTVAIINPTTSGITGLQATSVATATPKLVSGITSGFTGTTATAGAAITYSTTMTGITAAQYALLRADTYTVSVTYTLSDTL